MSGPKISVYDLTGWARSVVMGQIRCEQESVRCADQITGFLREGHCLENSVETTKQRLLLLQKRTGEGAEHIKTIEEVLLRADKELCNARDELNANMPHISEKYVISEEAYEQKKQQLARIKKIKDTIVTTINELNSTLSDKQYGSLETANRIEESIAEDLSGVLSFYIPIEDESAQFDEEKQLLNQKLMEMLAQDHPDYVRQKIRNAVSALARIYDSTHLATFKKVTFQRLVAEIETCENERRQKESIFSEIAICGHQRPLVRW